MPINKVYSVALFLFSLSRLNPSHFYLYTLLFALCLSQRLVSSFVFTPLQGGLCGSSTELTDGRKLAYIFKYLIFIFVIIFRKLWHPLFYSRLFEIIYVFFSLLTFFFILSHHWLIWNCYYLLEQFVDDVMPLVAFYDVGEIGNLEFNIFSHDVDGAQMIHFREPICIWFVFISVFFIDGGCSFFVKFDKTELSG